MKWFDSNGREACDVEVDGIGVDRFVSKATYLDDGASVPEDELENMQKDKCLCRGCLESE